MYFNLTFGFYTVPQGEGKTECCEGNDHQGKPTRVALSVCRRTIWRWPIVQYPHINTHAIHFVLFYFWLFCVHVHSTGDTIQYDTGSPFTFHFISSLSCASVVVVFITISLFLPSHNKNNNNNVKFFL